MHADEPRPSRRRHGQESPPAGPEPGPCREGEPDEDPLPTTLIAARTLLYVGAVVGLVTGGLLTLALLLMGSELEAYLVVPALGPMVLGYGAITLLVGRLLARRIRPVRRLAVHLQVLLGFVCVLYAMASAARIVTTGIAGVFPLLVSLVCLSYGIAVAALVLWPSSTDYYLRRPHEGVVPMRPWRRVRCSWPEPVGPEPSRGR